MGNFFKLLVWQRSKDLAIEIYKVTQGIRLSKDFGLRDQIQRAAVSIPANIAEGDELGTDKQSTRHFYIAKGSTAELMTELIIAKEIGYINSQSLERLLGECKIISTMLLKLIKSRS